MLYGLGAPDTLGPARAALPSCFNQELLNCLTHDNAEGLPPASCAAIKAAYDADDKTSLAIDSAVNALPVCGKASDMVPFIGMAFAAGVLAASLVLRGR